jgi:hypothetical protein
MDEYLHEYEYSLVPTFDADEYDPEEDGYFEFLPEDKMYIVTILNRREWCWINACINIVDLFCKHLFLQTWQFNRVHTISHK